MRAPSGRRSQRGAAALEFGLVFPLVLAVIFGIIQYGYHFWSLHTAAATARETARLLVVGSDWGCARAYGVSFAEGPAVGAGVPTVSRRYHTADGATQDTAVPGSMVTVTVSFQSLHIGLLPVPDSGVVEQSATARIENVPPRRLRCDGSLDAVVDGTA
jgi:Flp pilus assembly protein TadG